MADFNKEFKEALAEGIRRQITFDQVAKQGGLRAPGKTLGASIPFGGNAEFKDDERVMTGYDPATGETTVAFTLEASMIDGDDIWSM